MKKNCEKRAVPPRNGLRPAEAIKTMRTRTIVVLILVGILLSQLVVSLARNFFVADEVVAAQKFTPETVESVPESFLKGGDQRLQALVELNKTMRENGRKLDRIAEKLDEMNKNLKGLAKER